MILVWSLLFGGYIYCASLIVPRSTIDRYKASPKDWQYWIGHLLFYSIPASWFLGVGQSSPNMVLAGIVLFATGGALNIWAMVSNPYFLPNIEVPVRIARGGAYSWLNHPGYTAMTMMAAGSWLIVGHSLAVIPLVLYMQLLIWRANKETSLINQ